MTVELALPPWWRYCRSIDGYVCEVHQRRGGLSMTTAVSALVVRDAALARGDALRLAEEDALRKLRAAIPTGPVAVWG